MPVLNDAKNSNIGTSGTTVDVSITVGNNPNRALFAIIVHAQAAQNFASGVQVVSGSAFTFIDRTNVDGREAEIWVLKAPGTGAQTVRATFAGTINGDASVFVYSEYNVDQTTPYDNVNKGFTDNPFTLAGTDADGRVLFGVNVATTGTFSGDITSHDMLQGNSGAEYSLSAAGDGTSFSVSFSSSVRGWIGLNVKYQASEAAAPAMMGAMMF